MSDKMMLEILPDGTIKTTTDPISPANHQSAEAFLKGIQQLTGGEMSRTKRHTHSHSHAHTHEHATEKA